VKRALSQCNIKVSPDHPKDVREAKIIKHEIAYRGKRVGGGLKQTIEDEIRAS